MYLSTYNFTISFSETILLFLMMLQLEVYIFSQFFDKYIFTANEANNWADDWNNEWQ